MTKQFTFTVIGKGGHGAIPAPTIDPVPALSAAARDLQIFAPRHNVQVCFLSFDSGTRFNIIPNNASCTGTITFANQSDLDALISRVEHTCTAYRVTMQFQAQ